MQPDPTPPADAEGKAKLLAQSLFAGGPARYDLSPTTDGYPDVDTYRELQFYLEAVPAAATTRASSGTKPTADSRLR